MTAPRAVGVRIGYAATPAAVRAWVDEALGSPVVGTAEQVGGMSPGCATRVTCADGTRAFVKAAGAELNVDSLRLFRREVAVLEHLGGHELWARLLASYDDGAWVALLIEDVEGRHPDFADDAELEAVLTGVDRLGGVLHERGVPDDVDLLDVSAVFAKWAASLDSLAGAAPQTPVPDWLRSDPHGWADVLRQHAALPMPDPVHWDIRVDNLLRRPGGEIVFLDWGTTARGPAWADPLLARLERVDEPWFDTAVSSSPALVEAGHDAVTAFLAGFAAHMAVRSVVAVDVNLPTLNDFRVTESRRMLVAVARRSGREAGASDLGGHDACR